MFSWNSAHFPTICSRLLDGSSMHGIVKSLSAKFLCFAWESPWHTTGYVKQLRRPLGKTRGNKNQLLPTRNSYNKKMILRLLHNLFKLDV
jgi:hypothetical protein